MNVFHSCRNTSDIIPLYLPQQLFLKPIAKLHISVQLPQYKIMGKTISHWELMEKIRACVIPEEFTVLKVTKTTRESIQFEAEVEHKNKLPKVIEKLDKQMIKLSEINNLLKIRACEAKSDFPNKHLWDSYFRDATDMDEMKPGERPDTMYISNLPIRWFVAHHLSEETDVKPSEKIFYRIFEKFGVIRQVDIPICDPYRNKMKSHMSGLQTLSFNEKEIFEGYVQFKDYIGFMNAMDALRGMKLVHKQETSFYAVDIKVDFDKTKHLSEATIKRREIVRDRLVSKENRQQEKEKLAKQEELKQIEAKSQKDIALRKEKEKRRREREERRKAKVLAKLKVTESDDINHKIAKEEKKLLRVQRKLEAIRLVEELFQRIKIKKDTNASARLRSNKDEAAKLKKSSELDVLQQRDVLHRTIENRVLLKTILKKNTKTHAYSSSDSDSDSVPNQKTEDAVDNNKPSPSTDSYYPVDSNWYNFQHNMYSYPLGAVCTAARAHHLPYYPYHFRGRGRNAGPSRGVPFPKRGRSTFNPRFRGRGRGMPQYPPELQDEYYRYFQKFLYDDENGRGSRSYSRSRSRSPSGSRQRVSTRRSRSRSRHRSRSRRSRSHRSYSRSRRSYTRSRSRSRHSRSHSRRSRSYSRSRSRSGSRKSSRRSTPNKNKSREKSASPSGRSVDSSKFIYPAQMRKKRSKTETPPKD